MFVAFQHPKLVAAPPLGEGWIHEVKFDGYCFAEIPESNDPLRVLKYFRGMFRAYQNL